ncbi:hypothetical protein K1T35_48135 (plasmid) [Pseudonocardia sp. DSM 110487]|uniref:hypothetical protein n=1 Tax=Pseudonocardia sp. DSM 110487 TaxID=2865833 RepID=UPI001C6A3E30|nr:hypothetical protein [Pseudonocardia sp. DSM 110487]QYN41119.1 hypothetical protein K1T35_48135 [Pseudonocardia sp. DSM 110487]
MILNLPAVVAGTIWDTGPHAVVLALLPLVVALAGLVLRDPPDVPSARGLRITAAGAAARVRPALAGATAALRPDRIARPGRVRLREQTRQSLARAGRAAADALGIGRTR